MKANELRIGNYILDEANNQITVFSLIDYWGNREIGNDRINDDSISDRYNPISLTEEWLLKFGFEKHPIEDRYTSLGFCGLELVTKTGIDYFVVRSIRGDVISFIKYVHQIQNLYFALSGEELTIKE